MLPAGGGAFQTKHQQQAMGTSPPLNPGAGRIAHETGHYPIAETRAKQHMNPDAKNLMLAGAFLDRIGRSTDTKRGPAHMISLLNEMGIEVKKITNHGRGIGLLIDRDQAERLIQEHAYASKSDQSQSQLDRIEKKIDKLLTELSQQKNQ